MADLEEAMRDVVDPELGINVVDLGLVYGLNVEEAERRNGGTHRHDVDVGGLSAHRRHRGPVAQRTGREPAWSTRSRSTGCGTRPGGRTRSPRTAGNNCARWVSRFSRQSLSSLWALASRAVTGRPRHDAPCSSSPIPGRRLRGALTVDADHGERSEHANAACAVCLTIDARPMPKTSATCESPIKVVFVDPFTEPPVHIWHVNQMNEIGTRLHTQAHSVTGVACTCRPVE